MGSNLPPADTDDVVSLADWLEATMVLKEKGYLPRAKIRKYLRSLLAEEQSDAAIDALLKEIMRRRRHCGAAYPFNSDGQGIRYTQASDGTAYLFMLCLSVSKPYRE